MKASPVYRQLESTMMQEGINTRALAELLNMSYPALRSRIRGDTDFMLSEAIEIHSIIGCNMTIEQLFERGKP